MLMRLTTEGPVGLSHLTETYEMSLPALMKHVRVLEEAGLAVSVKRGRVRHVEAQAKTLRQAADWIERYTRFWNGALDRFADYVADSEEKPA